MIALEDAIDALNRLEASQDLDGSVNILVVRRFLELLKAKAEPLVIATDTDGFILEGAMQHGFDSIDDNVELYAVSGTKLIEYVKRQRRTASYRSTLRK